MSNRYLDDYGLASTRTWLTLTIVWIFLALILLFIVTNILDGALSIFAFVLLIIPLIVVLRSKNVEKVGIIPIPWGELVNSSF